MRTLRQLQAGVIVSAMCAAATPARADIPYDGWRGQRTQPQYAGAAGERRPLDNSPRGSWRAPPTQDSWSSAPAPAPAPAIRPSMWTGFYVGGHLGGAFGGSTPLGLSSEHIAIDGLVGGAHAGYNLSLGSFVLGAEADASLVGIDGTRHYAGLGTAASASLDWMATLRARAGFTWDNFLIFGTAGIAFNGLDLDVTAASQSSARDTLRGFVYGGGVEMKINPQLSARIEALRYNFGEETLGTVSGPISIGADVTTIRAGLSWHFN